MSLKLQQIIEVLEAAYPLHLAEDWDKNGLIVGDPGQVVSRVLLAVDPVQAVVEQAKELKADLIITHHPLFLRGTNFLPTTDPKGKLVAELYRHQIALYNCHTNADSAPDGVAQALAELVGLEDLSPLIPAPANPSPQTIATEPASTSVDRALSGTGRVGYLPSPVTLGEFAQQVAQALPASPGGLLVGGDLTDTVQKVVVSGGAGDSFLDLARQAKADVYLCADLRHHPASEHLETGKPYLLNATHWASEWPFLAKCARLLTETFRTGSAKLEVTVSEIITEPWSAHYPTGSQR